MSDCTLCTQCNKAHSDNLPSISSAFLIVTERCNLACRYCFVKQNAREMTLETAMDAVTFLIHNAELEKQTPSINFFGGEPLLRWDDIIVPVTEYVRNVYQKPFMLSMTTNGVLLTQEKLDYMKANQISFLFSIDGDKITQDFNRPFHDGRGSFDALLPIMKKVLAFEPNSTFRATIDHRTVEHMYHNMRFADTMGYTNMFFVPNNFVHWSDEHKQELKTQLRLFSDWFIDEARKGRIIHFSPFHEKIRDIAKINTASDAKTHRKCNKILGQGKCGLGTNRFASIGTDGTLYGCQEMTSNEDTNDVFVIGDIYTGTNHALRLRLANRFDNKKITGGDCNTCLFDAVCDGGCIANNFLVTGDMNKMPDIMCFWYQALLEEAIRVSCILGEEKNELFKARFFSPVSHKKEGVF